MEVGPLMGVGTGEAEVASAPEQNYGEQLIGLHLVFPFFMHFFKYFGRHHKHL